LDTGLVRPRTEGFLEARSVTLRLGDREILKGVSLKVPRGSVAAVVGNNGSGKTSLLRILAGVLTATEGAIEVCGQRPGKGRSFLVPAGDRMLHWRLRAAQDVGFIAALAGASKDEIGPITLEAATLFGAGDLLDRRVGECSTGQRRRLMLAAAFTTRVSVLLLDEPLADLDDDGRDQVAGAFRHWTSLGGCVVYAAPSLDPALMASVVIELESSPNPGPR
jgi:ABC-2 type transport system ATP-binding protein